MKFKLLQTGRQSIGRCPLPTPQHLLGNRVLRLFFSRSSHSTAGTHIHICMHDNHQEQSNCSSANGKSQLCKHSWQGINMDCAHTQLHLCKLIYSSGAAQPSTTRSLSRLADIHKLNSKSWHQIQQSVGPLYEAAAVIVAGIECLLPGAIYIVACQTRKYAKRLNSDSNSVRSKELPNTTMCSFPARLHPGTHSTHTHNTYYMYCVYTCVYIYICIKMYLYTNMFMPPGARKCLKPATGTKCPLGNFDLHGLM